MTMQYEDNGRVVAMDDGRKVMVHLIDHGCDKETEGMYDQAREDLADMTAYFGSLGLGVLKWYDLHAKEDKFEEMSIFVAGLELSEEDAQEVADFVYLDWTSDDEEDESGK